MPYAIFTRQVLNVSSLFAYVCMCFGIICSRRGCHTQSHYIFTSLHFLITDGLLLFFKLTSFTCVSISIFIREINFNNFCAVGVDKIIFWKRKHFYDFCRMQDKKNSSTFMVDEGKRSAASIKCDNLWLGISEIEKIHIFGIRMYMVCSAQLMNGSFAPLIWYLWNLYEMVNWNHSRDTISNVGPGGIIRVVYIDY